MVLYGRNEATTHTLRPGPNDNVLLTHSRTVSIGRCSAVAHSALVSRLRRPHARYRALRRLLQSVDTHESVDTHKSVDPHEANVTHVLADTH